MILPHGADSVIMPGITVIPHMGTVAALICFLIAVLVTAQKSYEQFGGDRKKVLAAFIAVPIFSTVVLFLCYGESVETFKGLILSLLLLYASYSDIRTRECGDLLHVFIILTAFIGTPLGSVPKMLLVGSYVLALMIAASVLFKGKIGGADIKFSAACAFLLGPERGLLALAGGLIAAIAVNAAIRLIKHNKEKTGFPMIPYLAACVFAAYFI